MRIRIKQKSSFVKGEVGDIVDPPSELTRKLLTEGYADRVEGNRALDVPQEGAKDDAGDIANDPAAGSDPDDGAGEAVSPGRKRRRK